jgi:DNA-binding HxlR family transcriptional regulator
MAERHLLDALQDRLDESMPTMTQLCTGPTPELFRSLLARIGDKWTLLVIGVLGDERLRFTEIAEIIPGISRRMLTVTLRALERDGLVTRTVYAEVPPRVEYQLTGLGRSLQSVAILLADWVGQHQEVIVRHRAQFDRASGGETSETVTEAPVSVPE